jgi:hypothetical protein
MRRCDGIGVLAARSPAKSTTILIRPRSWPTCPLSVRVGRSYPEATSDHNVWFYQSRQCPLNCFNANCSFSEIK